MGILDALNSTDPNQQAQMAMAAHLLGARSVKGERGGFGQALGGGLLAYQQAMEQGQGNAMKRKMQQLQMDAAEREAKANLPPSAEDMAKFTGMMTGTPERMDVAGNPNAYMPPTPAQPANPMGAYGFAMGSQNPSMQKIGVQGMHQFPQLEATRMEKEENRTWRTQESQTTRDAAAKALQEKLIDARTSQAERLAAQKELREMQITAQRDMKQFGASLASGMRQPESPIAVMGPDGKSVYVSRADALGKTPASAEKGKGGPMSVTLQKELLESDDTVQSAKNVVGILENAKKINANAYSGYFAKGRATFASNMPGKTPGADATIDIDNMMTGQALESLKSIFGGMPTEGERKILLEMQASVDKTPEQREAIMNRAMAAAKRRGEYAGTKAKSIRDGSYLTQGMPELAPVDPPKPNKTIVRTGTLNGRKVNQYSDGTTDYAD